MSLDVSCDVRRWYVVHTKPKQEARAASNLRSWGIETFAPFLRERRFSIRTGGIDRDTPLFPRYIFARFAARTLLAKVRLTRGVHDVIGFGESATPVEDALIDTIRARTAPDGLVRMLQPEPGDTVRIEDGPLRSLVGVFERELRGSERVLILLTSIRAQARVDVPKAFIAKVALSTLI
jgi:transcriptional antiterminator RfaH